MKLHSAAERAGLEQGFVITGVEVPADRPAKEWLYLPAMLVLALVMGLQLRRTKPAPAPSPAAA